MIFYKHFRDVTQAIQDREPIAWAKSCSLENAIYNNTIKEQSAFYFSFPNDMQPSGYHLFAVYLWCSVVIWREHFGYIYIGVIAQSPVNAAAALQ